MTNENQLTREEQAWLVEYQVCQQSQNSSTQSYWALSGIFIGFTSALLGGLILGILSNPHLTQVLFGKEISVIQNNEFLIVGLIAWVLSMAVLVILYLLKGWLKRVNFLTYIQYQRMREIEFHLGMLKSFIVQGVDSPADLENELRKLNELDEEKARVIRNKLESYYCRWKSSYQNKYEPPSSMYHHKWIFLTLMSLWALVLLCSLILLGSYNCFVSLALTIISAVIWIILLTQKHELPT